MSGEDLTVSHPLRAHSRERLLVCAAVVAFIAFRSAIFVFNESIAFNSDQAVFGLMAKHLVEGRAFPLFMYGQNYILAVEAWLAAPVFFVLGASVTSLKLPLLAINIAIGLLLIRGLEREAGLRPALALVASLFFLLASPQTAATLVEASGGNVEPFLYVILLWMTRRRPVWFGLVLGLGFLHREFTIYGASAIFMIGVASGAWRSKEARQRLLRALRVAVESWLVVQFLRAFASASGPGTTIADLSMPSNNLIEVMQRFCFSARMLIVGLGRLITVHWPQLFGTRVVPVIADGIESRAIQGMTGAGWLLGAGALLVLARIVMQANTAPESWRRRPFSIYLALVGASSAGAFAVGRCGFVGTTRYDLLSILGGVGLVGWFLAIERHRWLRRVIVGIVLVWATVSIIGHAQIWAEYTRHPPVAAKTRIIRDLEVRGVKYATSDYWLAYYITFVTNERIIVAADEVPRILEYGQQVRDHHAEAIRISRRPCGDGARTFAGVYFCPPE